MTERDELLDDLTPAQREAVTHPGGPLLIVAGAGSGKTRVLSRRAGWLVRRGLPGRALLAITFTNKAAGVLRARLADLPGASDVWAGTFHGFGAWLLRRHGADLGIDPHFTIADREDQERLLKALVAERDLGSLALRPAALAAWISRRKNGDATLPYEWAREASALEALARAYAERLRAGSLLDFDDLLGESLRVLKGSPGAANALRARFAHVLVDEYQDTNRVQREIVLGLLGPARNLTVVGDPDQSIYRWRGATVENILGFTRDLPGARTVVLERNYRSTARILEVAEAVIARNRGRLEKRLVAAREQGQRVRVVRAADARDEGEAVAQAVEGWRRGGGRLSGVAVIYRVNALSRAVELALRARAIPYRVIAGVEFFHRQEVKDVLAFARLVENPRDEAAFARIANVPRRGVGETSLARVRAEAARRGVTWDEVVRSGAARLPAKAQRGLLDLAAQLERVRALPRTPVAPVLEALLELTGYAQHLADAGEEVSGTRRENVDELLAAAQEHDRTQPGSDLGGFLEATGLVSDQDALDEGAETVSLLSAHAAKGLEFPFVIVIGAELGLFPHARSMDDESALEEERRLFYVALTRAMDRLLITHVAWRALHRGLEPRSPSPYLRDMPAVAVEGEDRAGRMGARPWSTAGAGQLGEERPSYGVRAEPDEEGFGEEAAPSAAPEDAPYAPHEELPVERRDADEPLPGDRVRHPVFGVGRLFATHGSGASRIFTIDFEGSGRKQVSLSFARLERLP